MGTPDMPDFSGRVVVFYAEGVSPTPLLSPRLVEQGGRLFAIGRTPKGASAADWMADAEVAVAWDSVVQHVVFADLETYQQRVSKLSSDKGGWSFFR